MTKNLFDICNNCQYLDRYYSSVQKQSIPCSMIELLCHSCGRQTSILHWLLISQNYIHQYLFSSQTSQNMHAVRNITARKEVYIDLTMQGFYTLQQGNASSSVEMVQTLIHIYQNVKYISIIVMVDMGSTIQNMESMKAYLFPRINKTLLTSFMDTEKRHSVQQLSIMKRHY